LAATASRLAFLKAAKYLEPITRIAVVIMPEVPSPGKKSSGESSRANGLPPVIPGMAIGESTVTVSLQLPQERLALQLNAG